MSPKNSSGREYYKYAGLGFEFAAVVGLFGYFGYLADQRWGWNGTGIMIGGGVGLVGGIYLLAKQGFEMMREMDALENDEVHESEDSD